ncbi:MAG: hypothetical protein ABSE96_04750 [Terracidiphilus sp.]|jgi:hypothetical protein
MMKKQSIIALVTLLLIPLITVLGGMLSNLINPEIAAGHPNYVRNWHLLNLLKQTLFFGSAAAAGVLWLLVCLLVIRSKKRSYLWLVLAALGPFGLAVLAMLSDRAPLETDRYARFVRSMNGFVRGGYELFCFVIVWVLAYQAMVLNRELIIRYQAITTGVSTQQIIDLQNASSGMWAFAEGNEVIFLVALLYLLRPFVFGIVGHVVTARSSPRAG